MLVSLKTHGLQAHLPVWLDGVFFWVPCCRFSPVAEYAWMVRWEVSWTLMVGSVEGVQVSSEIGKWLAHSHCPHSGRAAGWAWGAAVLGPTWGWVGNCGELWPPVRSLVVLTILWKQRWPLNNFTYGAWVWAKQFHQWLECRNILGRISNLEKPSFSSVLQVLPLAFDI